MVKNKIYSAVFFIFILINANIALFAQTKAKIIINNAYLDNYKLFVKYSIQNARREEVFDVSLLAFRQNGQLLTPVHLQGDMYMQAGGQDKTIIWDMDQDKVYLDETINLQLKAEVSIDYSKFKLTSLMLQSTFLPGYGVYRLDRSKKFYFWTATGYTAAAASGIFYLSTLTNYYNYLASTEPAVRQDYLEKAKSFQTYTYVSLASAAIIWGINYFRTYIFYRSKIKH